MSNTNKPFISIILPAYNEEAILTDNVHLIANYLTTLEDTYNWEIIIINDGSKDKTGIIADSLSIENNRIRVVHHLFNRNLGHALRSGFINAKGEYIVVMDIDLSYSVDHIKILVDSIIAEGADIIVASPYMKGGKVTAVPFLRKIMSKWVNNFMRLASQEKYYTFTGMVRAYNSSFIRSLNLKTKDYEINPEIMYKAMILRARIIEVPAHLDWTEQNKVADKRTSSIRLIRGTFSGLMSAFIFRPYIFFIAIGSFLMILSMYSLIWLLVDTLSYLSILHQDLSKIDNPFSYSLAQQFKKNPQSFIVGGITFLAAIQFLGLGFLSLQNKRYFEELFHITSAIKKEISKRE